MRPFGYTANAWARELPRWAPVRGLEAEAQANLRLV